MFKRGCRGTHQKMIAKHLNHHVRSPLDDTASATSTHWSGYGRSIPSHAGDPAAAQGPDQGQRTRLGNEGGRVNFGLAKRSAKDGVATPLPLRYSSGREVAAANWKHQIIWTGDNLDIMRDMNSEWADVIFLERPRNRRVKR